jgi:cytochrome c-type biogenesis protein CcmE
MTPRRRRLWLVVGILVGVSAAGALALTAFRQNVTFYFVPTEVAAGKVPAGEHFRLGGMVEKGSVQRAPGSLQVHFVVTDFQHDVPVTYTGVLPDLFREGQGVVAHGQLGSNGVFVAEEVLAKHDEKYMPPQIAQALKDRHAGAVTAPSPPAPGAPRSPASGGF